MGLPEIVSTELRGWLEEQTEALLANYRIDISKHLDRIGQALARIEEASEQLLEEVVVEGELTVPGAASKLASRMKALSSGLEVPEHLTFTSVQALIEDLEGLLRSSTEAGRRYVPRLPPVHKRVIKELDSQIRMIGQAYNKIKKIDEKNKLPKELDEVAADVQELDQKAALLVRIVEELEELQQQQEHTAEKIEEQQEGIEQFRVESGLVEIDAIRREVDAIRMLVTNQLNFLKKPFKKLSQAAGNAVMIPSVAGEGADAYSVDPWKAFQNDTGTLEKLKTGLSALAEAAQTRKIKIKQSVERKIVDRMKDIVEQGTLDEYHTRFLGLKRRQQELAEGISVDERRELEKTLERAQWENRDVRAEIARSEEQLERTSDRVKILKKKIERSLNRVVRDKISITFPEDVQVIIKED